MSMHKGIYLKKISVIGTDKEPADIIFDRGLNVISGPSNTGKSYIFQCIDFIFGAKDSPKPITEAKDYEQIRAEIRTFEGKVFTVSRQFNDSHIYVTETNFDNYNTKDAKKFSTVHSAKNQLNISNFILDLLGLTGKKLKKNARNETKNLSFRDLAKFCLASEEKIIKSSSPIYTEQYTEETINKSLFKLLLTGKDDDDLEQIENQEIARSRINGKIELIKETIVTKEKRLFEIKKRIEILSDDDIGVKIEEFVQLVNNIQNSILEEEKKRQKVWSDLDTKKSALNQTIDLINRFELLNTHYTSDLNRLEFINEGKQYMEQLKQVNCPLCDNLIDQQLLERYEDEDSKMLDSVKGEFIKITAKQKELLDTIENLKVTKSELTESVKTKQDEYNNISNYISNKLKPFHKANNNNLQNFLKLRDEKGQISIIEEEITNLGNNLAYYKEKLNEKQKTAPETIMPEQVYLELAEEIKKVLSSWGINCSTVYYDPTANDIEIDGEKRQNFGKGFRAIYLSAFMVAVMVYCLKKGHKHPFFLVLDSPLTAYKERDNVLDSSDDPNDQLPENIQEKFYTSLAELETIQDIQIIVIDNKDPPEYLKKKITYEHFTKNPSQGRYGFYPSIPTTQIR